ncbi:hypothetical protein QQ008_06765 [Fulvivirgaceae bacterium BMA10]|uniref:Uncharacterized protein n=1 Tax=Splendidivirga corallicola TaxID=3051826 RepID=A0ABT8KLE0_9BACT|nr:hypothetical protein [Fulvivirgaceae bacterium BMA10]
MKNLKFSILLILVIIVVNACKEDDEVVAPAKPQQPETEKEEVSEDGNIVIYEVNGDQLSVIKEFKVKDRYKFFAREATHDEVWKFFVKLIPAEIRPQMKRLLLFADSESGVGAYVGPVDPDGKNLKEWEMGLNLDAFYQNEVLDKPEAGAIIIHEFGHLLTLHEGQINSGVDSATCSNFFTSEGCSRKDSYLTPFFGKFWNDIHAESLKIESAEGEEKFYNKYKDRFLTRYAATNPAEDIAESFTYFVLKNNKASGNDVASQKLNFFYDFPEALNIREQIREGVDFNYDNINSRMGARRLKRICAKKH